MTERTNKKRLLQVPWKAIKRVELEIDERRVKILQLKIQKEKPKLNTDSRRRGTKHIHAILSSIILRQQW